MYFPTLPCTVTHNGRKSSKLPSRPGLALGILTDTLCSLTYVIIPFQCQPAGCCSSDISSVPVDQVGEES